MEKSDKQQPWSSSSSSSSLPMLGAIVGDIAGSTYERRNCKSTDCAIFAKHSWATDDSVLTLATAQYFLPSTSPACFDPKSTTTTTKTTSYTDVYQEMGRKYPNAGYGHSFSQWIFTCDPQPYGSWGNGSAMRASPIAWVADIDSDNDNNDNDKNETKKGLAWAMEEAKRSAEVTHNSPEGIIGAQAVVAATFLARQGKTKNEIRDFVTKTFRYDLNRTLEDIRPTYYFDVSCPGSVPEAIIAFLESTDFESAIRNAISLGGDSDTIACIAGSIAHAYYKSIPNWMVEYCREVLSRDQLAILDEFWKIHGETGSTASAAPSKV